MAYECQNFKDGQVLTAQCLNKMEKGIEEACKTGGADFAENDPNGEGYIKNRTHYSEWVDTVLFPEQTITISGNQYMAPGLMGLVVGETYTVVWNGLSYTCVAENNVVAGTNVPCVAIGNPVFVGGANNGMPFAAADVSSEGFCGFMAMADGNYTVSVYGKKEIVHKLPTKYSNEFRVQVVKNGNTNYIVMNTLAEIVAAIEDGMQLYVIVESYWSNGTHEWQRFDMTKAVYNKQYLSEASNMETYFVFASDVLEDRLNTYRKYIFVIANFNGGDQLMGGMMSVQKTVLD